MLNSVQSTSYTNFIDTGSTAVGPISDRLCIMEIKETRPNSLFTRNFYLVFLMAAAAVTLCKNKKIAILALNLILTIILTQTQNLTQQ